MSHKNLVLETIIEQQNSEIDTLRELLSKREFELKLMQVEVHNEQVKFETERKNNAAWVSLANGIMRDIALDIVLDRTHRERNDAYRWLVRRIKTAIENVKLHHQSDLDDIPF